MQVNHEENIQNSIKSLLDSYENAPTEIIEKYGLLFSCILARSERQPIVRQKFTFYPETGRIISPCKSHIIQLTNVQNEIFYLLSKNMNTGQFINQDALYNFVYPNGTYNRVGYDKPQLDTLKVHIYKINIKLNPLKIMIRHNLYGGWSIRTERADILPLNENKTNFPKGRAFN